MATRAATSEEVLSAVPAVKNQVDKRFWIIASLLTVYIIWGTTYLAIRYALEGFPPYLMMGIRFTIAGGGLLLFLRLRGAAMPTLNNWRSAAIVGGLLLVGGMGSVAMAEREISSGLAATLVAGAPLWTLLISLIWKHRPSRMEWIGVVIGILGVGLLTMEGNLQANPSGVALMLFATICWSLGSVWSNYLNIAPGAMGNATEMLIGGVVLVVLGLLKGEQIATPPTGSAWLALAYLTTFGSLATMTAYMFLLKTVSHSLATSYAFVNPAIALLLGVLVGDDKITGSVLIALPVILIGVGFIAFGKRNKAITQQPE
jgi:drug/metabolite transporter (DMT)-like permease